MSSTMRDLEAATEVGWGGTRARAGVEVERGGGVAERPAEVVRGELAAEGAVGVAPQVDRSIAGSNPNKM